MTFFGGIPGASGLGSETEMENQLKQVLSGLSLSAPSLRVDEVLDWAAGIGVALRSQKVPKFEHVSIHLGLLRFGVTFDPIVLQKRSTLDPRAYAKSLLAGFGHVDAGGEFVTPTLLATFYGIPSMVGLLERIQTSLRAKARAIIARNHLSSRELLAFSLYQLSQLHLTPKLKLFSSMAELEKLWALDGKELSRELNAVLKELLVEVCPKELGKELLKEREQERERKLLSEQSNNSIESKRSFEAAAINGSSANQQRKSSRRTSAVRSEHPLKIFSCAAHGPAFGPYFLCE